MRNKLHRLTVMTTGLLLACGFVSQSCGTAQQVGDDIMRAGGISSTGNKDDDETRTTQAKQETPQAMPIPGNSALVCEDPVDLSGRAYAFLEQPQADQKACTGEERSLECVDQMVFTTNEDVSIRLRMEGEQTLTVTATYKMCALDLGIWTVDAQGASQIDSFKSSEDTDILTHIKSGHAFQLIQ